ncbi:hypothetical protein AA313_de0201874 [Arthrobotrys entomopaga]|nr:hypothetical protein AA313_de0201874 [Arthrobotrys entomopaga]
MNLRFKPLLLLGLSSLLVSVDGKKGFTDLVTWESWIHSPQSLRYPFDGDRSPEWHLKRLGEKLADLFKKVRVTHPVLANVQQIDLGIANRRPKDLLSLTMNIIDGIRAVQRAEEGRDEANILELEADEFSPEESFAIGSNLNSEQTGRDTETSMTRFIGDEQLSSQGLRTRFRDFEVEAQAIFDSTADLKLDIWGQRTGPVYPTGAYAAILNAYESLHARIPLQDEFALSLWVFNGTIWGQVRGSEAKVFYNTEAKEDLKMAFDALRKTFANIDKQLWDWMIKVYDSLRNKDHIDLVKQHVIDLQIFTWVYKVACDQIFELLDTGIFLPSSILRN